MNILEICNQAHGTAITKGWYDTGRELPELIALIHSELSEALEEWRNHGLTTMHVGNKPEGVVYELADAVIRICDAAQFYNLDLQDAIREKMEYNRTRPYRHGNKRA